MYQNDGEETVSDVNKSCLSEMDDEKLENDELKRAEQCELFSGLGESNSDVGGERDETVSLEDKSVGTQGGETAVLEKSELTVDMIEETEIVAEATVGAGGIIEARSAEQSVELKNDALEGMDTVVTDTWDTQFEPQLEKKVEDELLPVIEFKMEVDVTDLGDAEPFAELQMGATLDELTEKRKGMEAQYDNTKREMGNGEMIDEVGGMNNDLIEMLAGEKDAEMAEGEKSEMGDDEKIEEMGGTDNDLIETLVREKDTERVMEGKESEKLDVSVNDSEVCNAENPVISGEKKVEPLFNEASEPEMEAITEVNGNTVNASEQDQIIKLNDGIEDVNGDLKYENAEDNEIIAEGTLISGAKLVDDNMNGDVLKNPELDEPETVAENKEEVVVAEEHPAEDVRMEMKAGAESELGKSDVAEEIQSDDGEAEMETENQDMVNEVLDESAKMETNETRSDLDEPGAEMDDIPDALHDEENDSMLAEEETGTQYTEIETETDAAESSKASAGKQKRGKLSKSPTSKPTARSSSRKTISEDVCFICFDGGDLFLCDRRGCPKAYHPSCISRDEAFFRTKGRWNCGWHMCSICEKTARYMCFTCTYSLCKSCTKDGVILCVRGNKGFCETCMRTVNLVENNEHGNKEMQPQIDFDGRSTWEYLFKDYYIELKSKLSLSYDEIAEAKNPWKGASVSSGPRKQEISAVQVDPDDGRSGSDDSVEKLEISRPKKRKLRKQSKSLTRKEESGRKIIAIGDKATSSDKSDWASKELLEFVSHMKDGDTSIISQFEVQKLLLEYIKNNKLRDPRRKSQIICDARLESLFGKPRVGHFEMLKLLESHFFAREEQNDDGQGIVVDTENNQLDTDDNGDLTISKRRKAHRKSDSLVRQSNLDDYAAIDMHNITLIYLKRKLMEVLLEDTESFNEKSIGTFARIRISGSNQKQDLYRLVQVVGTSKAPEPYKVGKKTTDIMVEILNLDKTEVIAIDTISNQEFTEEECKRLRQSIKCGLLSRLTVGEILDKAMEIQVARVNDWLESETLRLSHLRDRASDLGRRKELRECVEKLLLLKTPEERRRRLEEVPKVHADPKMDPNYDSDENDSENENSRRDAFMRSKGFSRRGRGPIFPGSDGSQKESWSSATKTRNKNWELSKNNFSVGSTHVAEIGNENSWNLGDKGTDESINVEKLNSASYSDPPERVVHTVSRSDSFSGVTTVTSQSPISSGAVESPVKINESEKLWHYRDPAGKEQGPFSMVQLRKWSNTGYFPNDLKIWRNTEEESDYILLADALEEKLLKELPSDVNILQATNHSGKISGTFLDRERPHTDLSPVAAKLSTERWSRNEMSNLPTPIPRQSIPGPTRIEGMATQVTGGNGVLPSPTVVLPSAASSLLNSIIQPGVPFSPTPNSHQATPVGPTDYHHHQSTMPTEPHPSQMHGQAVINQNLQAQPQQAYSMATPNIQNSSGTFSNSSPATLPQSVLWRPPTQGGQMNVLPPTIPTTPNASWGMRPPDNNTSSGLNHANPNVGWGPVQVNAKMGLGSWGPPVQAPNPGSFAPGGGDGPIGVNMNPGWGPLAQGWAPAPVQGPAWGPPGGNPGGLAPVQGPVSGNGWIPPNGNPGTPVLVRHPGQSNPNQECGPPQGNQGPWGDEQNHNGGQGRDSGLDGGRPWNRGGGGSGGHFSKGGMLCPYNGNGRCRKGANCDYRHI